MCHRARMLGEPETLRTRFGADWLADRPLDNRFSPVELIPTTRAYVVREEAGKRAVDIMSWDVLCGEANWPMTNVRNLALPQWRKLAERPENRCLIPSTEFAEFTPEKYDLSDGKPPLKGEMSNWVELGRFQSNLRSKISGL